MTSFRIAILFMPPPRRLWGAPVWAVFALCLALSPRPVGGQVTARSQMAFAQSSSVLMSAYG